MHVLAVLLLPVSSRCLAAHFSVSVYCIVLITFLISLSLSYTEADSAATNSVKTASSSNKRRWDQETPDEPFNKKTDTWQAVKTKEKEEESSSTKTPEVSNNKETSHADPEPPKKKGFSLGIKKNKMTPAPIKITLGAQVSIHKSVYCLL